MLAEDGNPSALAAVLDGSDEVLDMKVADGPLLPGATMVFELESRGRFNRVSAVGMLVTTNDASLFPAYLTSFLLRPPMHRTQRYYLASWSKTPLCTAPRRPRHETR